MGSKPKPSILSFGSWQRYSQCIGLFFSYKEGNRSAVEKGLVVGKQVLLRVKQILRPKRLLREVGRSGMMISNVFIESEDFQLPFCMIGREEKRRAGRGFFFYYGQQYLQ